jgi:hypothetical protein
VILVQPVDLAAVLRAVPAEPLGELLSEFGGLVWVLLGHRVSHLSGYL